MSTRFTTDSLADRYMPPDGESESTVSLLRRLADELVMLFRQEIQLATVEVTAALTKLAAGVASIAAGGAILFAGLMVLLASAVFGLSLVVAPWLAALIVGTVTTLAGVLLVNAGRKAADFSILKPRRSVESLRQDKEILTRKEP